MRFIKKKVVVLIALTEHIGDIVACEPISRFCRACHKNAYIIWCVKKEYSDILLYNPNIDMVLSVHCITEWVFLSQNKLFDKVYDLHIDESMCPTCRIPLRKKSNNGVTFKNYLSIGSLLSAFCQSAGLCPLSNDQPIMYIPANIRTEIDKFNLPMRYIVIHSVSNNSTKNWDSTKWNLLIKKLIDVHQLYLIEVGTKSAIAGLSSSKYLNMCGHLSILETAEVIRRALLFVGIDSGPAHIANAVQTKGIVLLGSFAGFSNYVPYGGLYKNNNNIALLRGHVCVNSIEWIHVYHSVVNAINYNTGTKKCVEYVVNNARG